MMKQPLEDPDLSRIVEVEHRDASEDDEYTPANQKASRGLEDEEEGQAPADLDDPKDRGAAASIVNFFA
jgi:hypothetical protein